MKREFNHENLHFEAFQNDGGYLEFWNIWFQQEISPKILADLRCAFNVLFVGKKMIDWDARNALEISESVLFA